MVIVQAFQPVAWNESAPGAPWGGQSTIWDACRDLMLASKGRYDQPLRFKSPRLHFELPTESTQPGRCEPPRSATLRRLPQWPAPAFDSSGYKTVTNLPLEPIPALPSSEQRLEDTLPRPAELRQELSEELPLQIRWPGLRGQRRCWQQPEANSQSPRRAVLRYGAALVRQRRMENEASQQSAESKSSGSSSNVMKASKSSTPSKSSRVSHVEAIDLIPPYVKPKF